MAPSGYIQTSADVAIEPEALNEGL